MTREFEVQREVVYPVSPEAVFAAVSTEQPAWMFPVGEIEPRLGGSAADGVVTAWDPPRRLAVRSEFPDGGFNALDYVIEGRGDGTTVLRYVHSGTLADDWDNQYDAIGQHTDFYLHTMGEYLVHFGGRPVTFVQANAPQISSGPTGFQQLRDRLGLAGSPAVGSTVRVELPGTDDQDAVIDYLQPNFVGLRTGDALYRFFGRNAFGGPVGLSVHHFGPNVDEDRLQLLAQTWLDSLFD